MATPITFIYGSCVARDMTRLYPDRFTTQGYIARESWVSAMSPPTPLPGSDPALKSKFQRRMVEYDLQSVLTEKLRDAADANDVLLLDIVDERVGVMGTAQGYITYSPEFMRSAWRDDLETSKLISFGSDRHFELWQQAAENLRNALVLLGLFDQTFLIRADFATESIQGDDLTKGITFTPTMRNKQYVRYYEHAEQLGFTLLRPPQELAVATRSHQWGLAPFHYIDDDYAAIADELAHHLAEKRA